jgi:hypothetical protein
VIRIALGVDTNPVAEPTACRARACARGTGLTAGAGPAASAAIIGIVAEIDARSAAIGLLGRTRSAVLTRAVDAHLTAAAGAAACPAILETDEQVHALVVAERRADVAGALPGGADQARGAPGGAGAAIEHIALYIDTARSAQSQRCGTSCRARSRVAHFVVSTRIPARTAIGRILRKTDAAAATVGVTDIAYAHARAADLEGVAGGGARPAIVGVAGQVDTARPALSQRSATLPGAQAQVAHLRRAAHDSARAAIRRAGVGVHAA